MIEKEKRLLGKQPADPNVPRALTSTEVEKLIKDVMDDLRNEPESDERPGLTVWARELIIQGR